MICQLYVVAGARCYNCLIGCDEGPKQNQKVGQQMKENKDLTALTIISLRSAAP